jgi:hypothetical protein
MPGVPMLYLVPACSRGILMPGIPMPGLVSPSGQGILMPSIPMPFAAPWDWPRCLFGLIPY